MNIAVKYERLNWINSLKNKMFEILPKFIQYVIINKSSLVNVTA